MSHRTLANGSQLVAPVPKRLSCDRRLVSLLQPDSMQAEQFRCLRYSLLRTVEGGHCNVIGISSPERGSGRTTTAINLAAALEETGIFRVLLVDADLRGAAVADRLALGNVDGGLDAALLDWNLGLQELVARQPESYGFNVLPTAPRPELAHRLLATPRFGMLMVEARQAYDFVIVDTPPLMPASDCHAMAPWLDGFVIVVAADKTPRGALEDCLNAMSPEQVLGLVFVGDDNLEIPRGDQRARNSRTPNGYA